jgi:hypothetical protein
MVNRVLTAMGWADQRNDVTGQDVVVGQSVLRQRRESLAGATTVNVIFRIRRSTFTE